MTAESIGYLVGMILGLALAYGCVWIIAATVCWKTRVGRWGTWGKVIAVIISVIITIPLYLLIVPPFIIGLYGVIKWYDLRKVKP